MTDVFRICTNDRRFVNCLVSTRKGVCRTNSRAPKAARVSMNLTLHEGCASRITSPEKIDLHEFAKYLLVLST